MRYAFQFKINFTGGIVSPGYLLQLTQYLKESGIEEVRIGLRQQLLIDASKKQMEKLEEVLNKNGIHFELNKDEFPNIISSYPSEGLFASDSWLREGAYKDIFDLFDYAPRIKINISDAGQSFAPYFTGHINWIASPSTHFWYLVIRLPKTRELFQWPALIYTNDIPVLSKKLEALIQEQHIIDHQQLVDQISADTRLISKPVEQPLSLHKFQLPYYEGFNSYGNKSWLGIYRRDELFSVAFLTDIANACLTTKVGQLYTTAWKSLVIKGIEKSDRALWDYILGKYRINVRHAANELCWQVEDNTDEGLMIKRYIIRRFDKEDVRTFGLCFAVKTNQAATMFGSVLIERQYNTIKNKTVPLDSYHIYYTQNFNPNSTQYVLFREGIKKEYLDVYLVSVCKFFYETQSAEMDEQLVASTTVSDTVVQKTEYHVYQCQHCLTVYDEMAGDESLNIMAGTLFKQLPETYHCPLCDAPKKDMELIQREKIAVLSM